MAVICGFEKGSVAHRAGLKIGDDVIGINGRPFCDILDYLFADGDENVRIDYVRKEKYCSVAVRKEGDTSLGIDFGEALEITPKRCKNKCLFCFVDQLQKNLRPTMYIKDDDYRMSVMCGNYVTLTNMTEDDYKRIIDYKLSPLYVSVHAADNEVRKKLVSNPRTLTLMDDLKRLTDNGITVHTQVVLCEGINDAEILRDTLEKLYAMHPMVASLAVVPVGLTGHREGLYPLKPLSDKCLNDTIDTVETFNDGKNWCWCSDEFYVKTGRKMPDYNYYGDFPQIENGVGLIADFDMNVADSLEGYAEGAIDGKGKKIAFITGESFGAHLQKTIEKLEKYTKNLQMTVFPVKNTFFGGAVTVSGLVVGRDIIAQVEKDYDAYVVPHNMLRECDDKGLFLDDTTLDEVKTALRAGRIIVSGTNGGDLVKILESVKND